MGRSSGAQSLSNSARTWKARALATALEPAGPAPVARTVGHCSSSASLGGEDVGQPGVHPPSRLTLGWR